MSARINWGPARHAVIIERKNFDALFSSLHARGYSVVGPTLREGAIIYDRITGSSELPNGWGDEQMPGKYRLVKRKNNSCFGFNSTVQSWKRFVHPPNKLLFQSRKNSGGITVSPVAETTEKLAFLGVRACDLRALRTLGKVFTDAGERDPAADILIVAVNCGQAGGTCFCASMESGPRAETGFDIALTEVIEKKRHYFVAETGTKKGDEIIKTVQRRGAKEDEIRTAGRIMAKTAAQMGRKVDVAGIKEILYKNADHARWNETAKRCLTCANCTMVCPTCFCTTVEDVTDLKGSRAERWQKWDSCFTLNFTYIHGGCVRASVSSRYRQWLTHKFASWHDQFGTSGCVGCGRCITWCPVGIDVTEEIAAIRSHNGVNSSTKLKEEK